MQPIKKVAFMAPVLLLTLMQPAIAGHPLSTDDAGTLGKGSNLLEMNSDRIRDRDGNAQTVGDVTYTRGLIDTIDIFADQPMSVSAPRGLNDTGIGLKWRYLEHGSTSLALKTTIAVGNANHDKGFGSGRTNYGAVMIASYETGPWGLHCNLGLSTNRFKSPEMRDSSRALLWRTSAAATYAVNPKLKMVGDIVVGRNPFNVASRHDPAYAMAGAVYALSDRIELDAGVRFGLNDVSIRHQFGAGIAIHL